ncbi:hypothetical protein ACFXP3_35585 [Streptomyces sp. NPDC059096]|uniref:hypothetical protein n=1 Tax=Streptomyces sp. NPDC059096 TaxID=3346727 RepID=UPI0036BC08CA
MAMPPGLNEATSCAYLLMRGIDESHLVLDGATKARLLEGGRRPLADPVHGGRLHRRLPRPRSVLPEVALRLAQWSALASSGIGPRVVETCIAMAERMADRARHGFTVRTGF